jgi:hypothetical protein
MTIFIVTPINSPETVAKAISERFSQDSYAIPRTSSWLVSFGGTAMELSKELGITDGTAGTGIVASISNYYGRAPTDVWEWMKSRVERG